MSTAHRHDASPAAADSGPRLDPKTYAKFAALIYSKAGIVLNDKKEALVQARVGKRMRQLGITQFADYLRHVEEDADGTELVQLLDVISTNVTSFYRESRHFEVLTDLLTRWQAAGQRTFAIWCAAASTGEEPYTLGMTVRQCLNSGSDCRILGTDISTRVLARARQGRYSARDVEKVPAALLAKYFRKSKDGDTVHYQAEDSLTSMMTFARLNLATPPFPMRGPFDVIFCRNVMIYFDNEVRRRLLDECARLLRPGGYLMVGHAESLSGLLSSFKPVEPAIYIKGQ